ncbi:GFA family protein [Collimonas pratensis]|uniref:GFA family protein n=1 Tax=Collimonas pratensis TaxID=279113 RepID=UPI003C72B8E1
MKGGCACGAIRYLASAPPRAGIHCQCRACQKSSGTGHTSNMVFEASCFAMDGPIKFWPSQADSGHTVNRGFCEQCGSPILSNSSGMPGLVFVRAASLDDPDIFLPTMIIHGNSAPEWDAIDLTLPYFSTEPNANAGKNIAVANGD